MERFGISEHHNKMGLFPLRKLRQIAKHHVVTSMLWQCASGTRFKGSRLREFSRAQAFAVRSDVGPFPRLVVFACRTTEPFHPKNVRLAWPYFNFSQEEHAYALRQKTETAQDCHTQAQEAAQEEPAQEEEPVAIPFVLSPEAAVGASEVAFFHLRRDLPVRRLSEVS